MKYSQAKHIGFESYCINFPIQKENIKLLEKMSLKNEKNYIKKN